VATLVRVGIATELIIIVVAALLGGLEPTKALSNMQLHLTIALPHCIRSDACG
jgi:hypothetical protein